MHIEDHEDSHRYGNVEQHAEDEGNAHSSKFNKIMIGNRQWAQKCIEQQPDYFRNMQKIKKPKYFWIGCADSRVPANQIIGVHPGQVLVHKNVANIVPPSDINVLAVVQYAVQQLQVQDIIVAGHYGCGGIKSAFQQNDFGPLESWLSHVRQIRSKFRQSLIGSQAQKQRTLVQLNVRQQVINVSRIPSVQKVWLSSPRRLSIHGVVYNLENGVLKDLGLTMNKLQDVPEEYRLANQVTKAKTF